MVDYLELVQRRTGTFQKYSLSAATDREDGGNNNNDRVSVSSFDDSIAPGYGHNNMRRSSGGRSVNIR